jgi:hypothetical protein
MNPLDTLKDIDFSNMKVDIMYLNLDLNNIELGRKSG